MKSHIQSNHKKGNKRQFFTLAILLTFSLMANAQVSIGNSSPDVSAMLDLTSTSKGLLAPRLSTGNRGAMVSPATGLTIYNTTTQRMEVNTGTPGSPNWQPLGGTGVNIYNTNGTLGGARLVTMGSNTINFTGGNVGIGAATPGSTLQVAGSFAANYKTQSATPYTILATDFYVVYTGAGAGTFNLPASTAAMKGRLYNVKNATAAQTLSLVPNGSQTIDGSASIAVSAGTTVQVVSTGLTTGATWEVVSFTAATTAVPANIYTGDGTLTGARTINNLGNSITVTGTATEPLILANTAATSNDLRIQNTAGQGRLAVAGAANNFSALQAGDFMINGNTAGKGVGLSIAGISTPVLYAQGTSGNVGIGTTTPKSGLEINGAIAANYRFVTGTTTLSATDRIVYVNNGASNVTITLPAVATSTQRLMTIVRYGNSTGVITIAAAAGDEIGSIAGVYTASTTTLAAQGTYGAKVTFQASAPGVGYWFRYENN